MGYGEARLWVVVAGALSREAEVVYAEKRRRGWVCSGVQGHHLAMPCLVGPAQLARFSQDSSLCHRSRTHLCARVNHG